MTSFTRIALAGLATLVLAGSAEAMPVATTAAPSAPIVKSALIVTKKIVRRRPMMRPMVRRKVIIKKVIR